MVISHGINNIMKILENGDYLILAWKDHMTVLRKKTQESSLEITTQIPRVKCPKCDPLKDSAWMEREKLQDHIKTAHFGFW